MEAIYSRRSIRKYLSEPVSMEQVEQLLRAAMYAPSAGNEQPWHFVVVHNREKLTTITQYHPYTQMLHEAPLAIVPCADLRDVKYDGNFWIQDMSAAIQNLLLEAEDMGLGTCWCGVYPNQALVENTKALLSLPEWLVPVAIVAVGYPAEVRAVKERYHSDRVHWDAYSED